MSISRQRVYDMLTKENEYAQAWGGPEHDGQFHDSDWLLFAEIYFKEAKEAVARYTKDRRVIRQRMLKVAAMMVSGLEYLGEETDLDDVAGVSSSKFPVNTGSLKEFKKEKEKENGN